VDLCKEAVPVPAETKKFPSAIDFGPSVFDLALKRPCPTTFYMMALMRRAKKILLLHRK
jgi:hypothetical protein